MTTYISSEGVIYSEEALTELFDEFLDEHSDVKILGMDFCASFLLKNADPIHYRCMLSDFFSEFFEIPEMSEVEEEILISLVQDTEDPTYDMIDEFVELAQAI